MKTALGSGVLNFLRLRVKKEFDLSFRRNAGPVLVPYGPLQTLLDLPAPRPGIERVAYFGDSVLERVSRDDTDPRTLAELVTTAVSGRVEIIPFSHGAAHPALFHRLLQLLVDWKWRPSAVVIPINMRCFSPQWDHNPQWQFHEYLDAVRTFRTWHSSTAPLVPEIDTTVRRDPIFEAMLVDSPGTTCRTVGDFRKIIFSKPTDPMAVRARWREIFIYHYLPRLQPDQRRLRSLLAAKQLCDQAGIHTIFYVTPINYQAGLRLVKEPFAERFAENVRVVMSTVRAGLYSTVLDWSQNLDDRHFFHPDDPTEHLNQLGRAILAEMVSGVILSTHASATDGER